MRTKKVSVNKACMVLGAALLSAISAITIILYSLTGSLSAVLCCLSFFGFVLLCVACFIILVRRRLTLFSDLLCRTLDDMMSGNVEPPQMSEEESLFYKIHYRLERLYEVMDENRRSVAKEQADLQELVSDISHQVKTPIANLKMINSTLMEQEIPAQKQKEFLSACASQLDKLDFLMQAMIKTSRLETGVISLDKKKQPIYDTLASALGGILLNAEKKQIHVKVDCPEHLTVSQDRKWTGEALFNLLDNAVKYTPEEGRIAVIVECWELYLKISISDTGVKDIGYSVIIGNAVGDSFHKTPTELLGAYTYVTSFDFDKFVADFSLTDFTVSDTTVINSYAPFNTANVSRDFVSQAESLNGLEDMGNVYLWTSRQPLSEGDFTRLQELSVSSDDIANELGNYMVRQEQGVNVYGLDDFPAGYVQVLDGNLNMEQWKAGTGVYVTPLRMMGDGSLCLYRPGDKVSVPQLDGTRKVYDVLAVVDIPKALETPLQVDMGLDYIFPTDELLGNMVAADQPAMMTVFNVDDESLLPLKTG